MTQDQSEGVKGLDLIRDGWFHERGVLWPGQATSLQVEKLLHHTTSPYQDILVFRSATYGNVLVIDGVIQCTQRDEFAYQEMIAHLPLFAHPNPQSVLIIGGGDGGVLREVFRHTTVSKAVLCEIDQKVIDVATEYFEDMAASFRDPRAEVHVMDGAEYMNQHYDEFDVIIVDSSDPIGPAEVLFQMPFYQNMQKSLRKGGIICTQGECMWLHAELIRPLMLECNRIFPVVEYAYTAVPTYPSGQIGFILCSNSADMDLKTPQRKPTDDQQNILRYYNPQIHQTAFVLPQFAKRALLGL